MLKEFEGKLQESVNMEPDLEGWLRFLQVDGRRNVISGERKSSSEGIEL